MATLTIRNVPNSVRQALRMRAAKRGRSVEAEVRKILEDAVVDRQGVSDTHSADFEHDQLPSFVGAWKRTHTPDGRPIPEGRLLSEDFIATRRLEAAREVGLINEKEWTDLEARLDAFEIDLAWIEDFLAQRQR